MTQELEDKLKREYFIASYQKVPKISRDKERFGPRAHVISDYFGMLSFSFASERDITEDAVSAYVEKNVPDAAIREDVSNCMKETVREVRAKLGL